MSFLKSFRNGKKFGSQKWVFLIKSREKIFQLESDFRTMAQFGLELNNNKPEETNRRMNMRIQLNLGAP